jgi:hypothetical protein
MLGVYQMKKKIVCLIMSTLMIITVFPVVGYSLQTAEARDLTQPTFKAPIPGYVSNPPPNVLIDTSVAHDHPEKTPVTVDGTVVSILEQIDETTFLSYEETLLANGPRPTESASCEAAAEYMYNEFENLGLDVRYHHWNYAGYSSDNVEGTLYGTDETSDEIYIICGHYDTVSSSPGADDDTSGTIAVLMAATILSQYQFNHTIKFVAFSGEEQGLLGSAVYASEAANADWNIVGVLNCDMISYAVTVNDGRNLIVFENTASEWLYTYTNNINTEYSEYIGPLTLDHGGSTWGSDHNSFWDEGYDALFYFEYTETPYYHSPQDTIDHINATYAVKNMKLIFATLAELAEVGMVSDPPAKPVLTGPTTGVLDHLYTFTVVTTEPDNEDVYYLIDWGDGTNTGWLGPYSQGTDVDAQKSWSTEATYIVKAKAKDTNEVSSEWSDALSVAIIDDDAPKTPTLTGQKRGKVGTNYTFSASTVDVNGDDVYFFIEWGDGTNSSWVGPFSSGAIAEIDHAWDEKGTYTVMVKAKDVYGIESSWGSLTVVMPFEYKSSFSGFLQHLFERFPNMFPILRHLMGY